MTDKGLRGLTLMYIYHTGAEAGAILFDNRGNAELPSGWEENYFLIFSHQFFFGYVLLEAGLVFVVAST